MAIQLVDVEEMRSGRGGTGRKGTGIKYSKYRVAVERILPWIKEQIVEKQTIRVKNSDLAVEMGFGKDKHPTSFLWAMKYVLFNEGIWVEGGKTKDDQPVLVMRNATENDKLPDSLAKMGKGKGSEGGNGGESDKGGDGELEKEDNGDEKESQE